MESLWVNATFPSGARGSDDAGPEAGRHCHVMPLPLIPQSHLYGPPEPARRLRFMEVVRRRLRERRYSRRTEQAYVHWIRRYIVFHGRRHPSELGPHAVGRFLSDLAVEQRVSASTQNQALQALLFLYAQVLGTPLPRVDGVARARRSGYVPVVLSPHEVRALLGVLPEPARLCAMLMYGSGLRVAECMSLRVKDVDPDRLEIVVRGGRGQGSADPVGGIVRARADAPSEGGAASISTGSEGQRAHDRNLGGAGKKVSWGGERVGMVVRVPRNADLRGRGAGLSAASPARDRCAAFREECRSPTRDHKACDLSFTAPLICHPFA